MSTIDNVRVKYTGSALPGNGETVNIFTSANFPGAQMIQTMGLHRLYVAIVNDQTGTLKSYKSTNRGSTWTQIDSQAVGAVAANSENISDWVIEPYADWKLDWVNGTTPQGTFIVDAALQSNRPAVV